MQNYSLKVASLPSNDYAFKNCLFLSTKDFSGIKALNKVTGDEFYIKIREIVFSVKEISSVLAGILKGLKRL